MPYRETVEIQTLELIKALQDKEYLKDFYLVGGTALALYLGHRKSLDIDLFASEAFDTAALLENIQQDFPYQLTFTANNTLKGSIDNIKVDLLSHRYPYIQKPATIGGIRMLSLPDIAAMKLNAVATSGQRSKDFIDIFYLSEQFDMEEMLTFYKTKYNQENDTFLLKSLIYFDEVDQSDWPMLVKNPALKWRTVQKQLTTLVFQYVKQKGFDPA